MGIWVNAFKVKKVFEIGMNRIFFFFLHKAICLLDYKSHPQRRSLGQPVLNFSSLFRGMEVETTLPAPQCKLR